MPKGTEPSGPKKLKTAGKSPYPGMRHAAGRYAPVASLDAPVMGPAARIHAVLAPSSMDPVDLQRLAPIAPALLDAAADRPPVGRYARVHLRRHAGQSHARRQRPPGRSGWRGRREPHRDLAALLARGRLRPGWLRRRPAVRALPRLGQRPGPRPCCTSLPRAAAPASISRWIPTRAASAPSTPTICGSSRTSAGRTRRASSGTSRTSAAGPPGARGYRRRRHSSRRRSK